MDFHIYKTSKWEKYIPFFIIKLYKRPIRLVDCVLTGVDFGMSSTSDPIKQNIQFEYKEKIE